MFGYNGEPIEEGKTQPEKDVKLMTAISLVTGRPPAGLRTRLLGVCRPAGLTRPGPRGGSEGRRGAPGKNDIYADGQKNLKFAKVDDEFMKSRLSLYLMGRRSPGRVLKSRASASAPLST